MDTLSLCCLACLAFGDPTQVLGTGDGIRANAVAATSFSFRTEQPIQWSPFVPEQVQVDDLVLPFTSVDKKGVFRPTGGKDGLRLQKAKLALSGEVVDGVGVHGNMAATSAGFGTFEAYGDVRIIDGLSVRAGHWLTNVGGVSARRLGQRCFVDNPLMTSRFLGAGGLFETGMRLQYRLPSFPLIVQASVLSGQHGEHYGVPDPIPNTLDSVLPRAGEGGDIFSRLMYMARVAVNIGDIWDKHLWAGFTFVTGVNGTGEGNRTDLFAADLSGAYQLGNVQLGWDFEWMMRRYSVPGALYVEGGINADVVAAYDKWHGGLRFDMMGIPAPPTHDKLDGEWRVSAIAGYAVSDMVKFRLQYAARNDNAERATGHEVIAQAIVGIGGRLGGTIVAPPPLPAPVVAPPKPPVVAPPPAPPTPQPRPTPKAMPESSNAADWLRAANESLTHAEKLSGSGEHANSAFSAQQAAAKALQAVALAKKISAPAGDRSATSAIEALGKGGVASPGTVLDAAHELDRHYTISRYPPELGGTSGRYYDRASSTRAIGLARTIVRWADATLNPPPPPKEEPAPEPAPKPRPQTGVIELP